MDRIDEDDYSANGRGLAAAVRDHDGAMYVVGDEPVHRRGHQPGATGGRGFEGERSIPSPELNVAH